MYVNNWYSIVATRNSGVLSLYLNGISVIEDILKELDLWMYQKNFNTIEDFRSTALEFQSTDASFERIQYMKRDYLE